MCIRDSGYSPAEFGLYFSVTSLCYLIGNWANSRYFVARGIERAAMLGCCLSLLAVLGMTATQAAGYSSALSLVLPCCLFGFSNGIVVANTTVGAMSASGKHAGTGTGLTGAWQMAAGGIAGALIIAAGGDRHFSIAMAGMILMSVAAVASMTVVYLDSRPRPQARRV